MSDSSAINLSEHSLDPAALPTFMPVSVVMCRQPVHTTPWVDAQWTALAILVAPEAAVGNGDAVALPGDRFRYDGLRLALHKDQCESYYHNLLSDHPRLFVFARPDEEERARPFHVSASFDEAGAGMEDDEWVYDVAVPPEVYRWLEAYVLIHYVPQLKRKRRLTDWEGKTGAPADE